MRTVNPDIHTIKDMLELVPDHTRTSCNGDDDYNNGFPNESGYARCTRCALLRMHEWDGYLGTTLDVNINIKFHD